MASQEHYRIADEFRAFPYRPDATVQELREGFETLAQTRFRAPETGFRYENVNAGGVPAEWHIPDGQSGPRTILYIHGGGFCFGSTNTHRGLTSLLAEAANARALGLNYRLAPEHPFPAALDDCLAAYRWLLQQGVKPKDIVLAGDSAGGGLVLSTLVALKDAGEPLPAAGICMSPVTDLAKEGESMKTRAALDPMVRPESSAKNANRYIGDRDHKLPLASPLYADLRGLPPILLLVGTWEVLFDDSTRLAARAKEAGVKIEFEIWEEMMHVWPLFGKEMPEAMQAITRMGNFAKQQTP